MKHHTCQHCLSYLMECVDCGGMLSYHRSYRVTNKGPSHWEGECPRVQVARASAGPAGEEVSKVSKVSEASLPSDGEEIFRVSVPLKDHGTLEEVHEVYAKRVEDY